MKYTITYQSEHGVVHLRGLSEQTVERVLPTLSAQTPMVRPDLPLLPGFTRADIREF